MMRCGVAGSNSPELASCEAADVARVLDAGGLHAEADAEVGDVGLAGVADGVEHAFDAALAEAAGDEDAVEAFELRRRSRRPSRPSASIQVTRSLRLWASAPWTSASLSDLVAVLVLDVLADDADGDLVLRGCRRGGRCPATWRGRAPWRRCGGI